MAWIKPEGPTQDLGLCQRWDGLGGRWEGISGSREAGRASEGADWARLSQLGGPQRQLGGLGEDGEKNRIKSVVVVL